MLFTTTTQQTENKMKERKHNHRLLTGSPMLLLQLAVALVSCLLTFAIGADGRTESVETKQCQFNTFRLPKRVVPRHYDLLIKPDLVLQTYEGQVKIDVHVVGDDKCAAVSNTTTTTTTTSNVKSIGCDDNIIVLHSNLLEIKSAKYFMNIDGTNTADRAILRPVQVEELCLDPKNEMMSLRLAQRLPVGSHGRIVIHFDGQMSDREFKGFYMDSYRDKDNIRQPSGVTHFEAQHARRAFACFDEPQYKATFQVAIEHPRRLTAVSNMDVLHVEELEDRQDELGEPLVRTQFKRTPVMSTYLLAFALGEYDHLESVVQHHGRPLRLRILTEPGQASKAQFAMDTARRAFEVLTEYFNPIEQPLEKIDLLSVSSIMASAMENWGLITTNRDYLIQDQSTSALVHAHSVVLIAHELAHHWFGNLVTMKWWNNLWLNEAFAEWISYEVANEIYPEYNFHFLYLQESFMKGLKVDSDMSTHKVRNPHLQTIEEIERSFDSITYKKGAAVVTMLSAYMGSDNFKLAIRDYIKAHSYGNADAVDLWSALKAQSGMPIGKLMHSWLDQPGSPILEVSFHDDHHQTNNKRRVLIKQQRFMRRLTEQQEGDDQPQQLWLIPISVLVSSSDGLRSERIKFIMEEEKEKVFELPDWFEASRGDWFKLNADFDGFYRVNYDFEVLRLMQRPIEKKSMSPIDRLNVIDDIMAAYSFGLIDLDRVELFLDWLRNEDHAGVVYTMTQLIEMLRLLSLDSTDFRQHLVLVDYCNKQLNGFKFQPGERVIEARARLSTLLTLVRGNYRPILDEALGIFDASDDGQVPIEIREPVYAAVAQVGSDEQMDKLKKVLDSMSAGSAKKSLIESVMVATEWDRKYKIVGGL